GEFTPRNYRGRVLTAMDAWWPIGPALARLISAWSVSMWADPRPPLLAMLLAAILLIFVRLWTPEWTMFLIRNHSDSAARALTDFIAAWFVSMWADWRPPLLAMVLPAILLIFVLLWIPESPMFLIRNNRHREARAVIDGLVEATDAKPVKYRLETMTDVPKMSAGAVFDQLRRVWAFSWRTTLAVWLLFLTVMFVYYVSLQWLPTFLMEAGFEQT